ncbi:MAG: hypothetical protein JWO09_31 [Bacteroidetes bacterium]|nr:hypothetical protein [Bacteroidota bacterium]
MGGQRYKIYSESHKMSPQKYACFAIERMSTGQIPCKYLILSPGQQKLPSPKRLVLSDEPDNFIVKPNFY